LGGEVSSSVLYPYSDANLFIFPTLNLERAVASIDGDVPPAVAPIAAIVANSLDNHILGLVGNHYHLLGLKQKDHLLLLILIVYIILFYMEN
jgi:hypothetical protein